MPSNITEAQYANLVVLGNYLSDNGWFLGPGGLVVDGQGRLIDVEAGTPVRNLSDTNKWIAYLAGLGWSLTPGLMPMLRPLPTPASPTGGGPGPIGTRR